MEKKDLNSKIISLQISQAFDIIFEDINQEYKKNLSKIEEEKNKIKIYQHFLNCFLKKMQMIIRNSSKIEFISNSSIYSDLIEEFKNKIQSFNSKIPNNQFYDLFKPNFEKISIKFNFKEKCSKNEFIIKELEKKNQKLKKENESYKKIARISK
ncbi:hypothetical protein M0811_13499 [Anaeramoeba ignava]|uniref:Uncharacterized protein n=1 Tax=Anaeramoeba ignava TaxID=1746090 RepID=A0A9Q0L5A8_ANAIG|nr:hypothetical protein M0811_13499 [Anaeramoeba ignava]